jgi:DNA-binding CsgD family transcriptional regulator
MMGLMELKHDENADTYSLTRMELNCIALAANGFRAQEIGGRLGASEKEIEILLYCAERKLGARNRLHAIGIAVARGLIGIDT